MKKTLVALIIGSVVSAGAMANPANNVVFNGGKFKIDPNYKSELEKELNNSNDIIMSFFTNNTQKKTAIEKMAKKQKELNDVTKFKDSMNKIWENSNSIIDQEKDNYHYQVGINGNYHDIKENKVAITNNSSKITNNSSKITNNSSKIANNSSKIANNKKRITTLEKDFKNLSNDYYDFKEQTNGAIAGVAAMGQLAQPYGVGKANVGVGVGAYEKQQAVAIGIGYRYSEQTTFRGAVSANTGNDMNPVIAASVNYEW